MKDKIDTQGMGSGSFENVNSEYLVSRENEYPEDENGNIIYPKLKVKPCRLFTNMFVTEMKILINEVLDEREGKMDYQSYFDLTGRDYFVE